MKTEILFRSSSIMCFHTLNEEDKMILHRVAFDYHGYPLVDSILTGGRMLPIVIPSPPMNRDRCAVHCRSCGHLQPSARPVVYVYTVDILELLVSSHSDLIRKYLEKDSSKDGYIFMQYYDEFFNSILLLVMLCWTCNPSTDAQFCRETTGYPTADP